MIVEKCPLKPKDSILLQTMSNFGLLGSILDLYNAMKPQKISYGYEYQQTKKFKCVYIILRWIM